jgi:hypothetical protein
MIRTKFLLAISFLAAAQLASAHGRWILPSHTVVSGKEPVDIAVDISISNDVFHPDRGLGGTSIHELGQPAKPQRPGGRGSAPVSVDVVAPAGAQATSAQIINLGRKSVSAVTLPVDGTYRVGLSREPLYFVVYKTPEGERGRQFGRLASMTLPQGVSEVMEMENRFRTETFVTKNDLSVDSTAVTNADLELEYLTHPNELFVGETANFRLLIDGNPVANADLKITRGGTRHRNDREIIKVTTGAGGDFSVSWPDAGFYLIEAEHSARQSDTAMIRYGLYVTLEVNPE